ncbi:MAG: DUF123 domain-containing protein, partial [Bryobacteraceae bacterium]
GTNRPRWHVDWLRGIAEPVEVWFCQGGKRREHEWAAVLRSFADGIVAGFGSSDCECRSHLYYFRRRPHPALEGSARAQGWGPGERKIVRLSCQLCRISFIVCS